MGVIVQFNYAQWLSAFPAFASIGQMTAQSYFDLATSVHRNDGGGPVTSAAQQLTLLNLLTAHIAQLFSPQGSGQGGGLVGRINSATQGSVSVQAAYSNNVTEQMAWFIQTQYGALYWTASAPFRTMRYIPNKNRGVVGPPGFGV